MRQRLLEEVIHPYREWKDNRNVLDWNDLAVRLSTIQLDPRLDIVIVDEAQDFSANQVRAIRKQLADPFAVTFVLDTVQRIYARGFTWQEVEITIEPTRSRRLTVNYRNTVEIARFAQALIRDVPIDDDGTIPDFSTCTRSGERPKVLVGRYSQQTSFVLAWLREAVGLSSESVAFLHPRGWFDHLRTELRRAGFPYVELTRESDWPRGPENIALSTLHSWKGLEFDHVLILGLNQEVTAHGEDEKFWGSERDLQ